MSDLPCIYFVGAECTGKTTLVGFVEEAFHIPRLRGESARIVKDEYGGWGAIRARGKNSDGYQRAVFEQQIVMEIAQKPPYVADRCLLDSLGYASEYADNVEQLHSQLGGAVLTRLQNGVVFLVKPHKELSVADGERLVVSYEQQVRVDAKIELLLQLHRIRPVRIVDVCAARREQQISLYLEAKGFVKRNGY